MTFHTKRERTVKPTIKSLREQARLARATFARYAGLSDDTQVKIESGEPVSRRSAELALSAANRLMGTSYTLDQVDIALLDGSQ